MTINLNILLRNIEENTSEHTNTVYNWWIDTPERSILCVKFYLFNFTHFYIISFYGDYRQQQGLY